MSVTNSSPSTLAPLLDITTAEESTHPSKSVLGFSKDLISKLNKSHQALQTYTSQQKELIDSAYNRQAHLAESEQDTINSQLNELKQVLIRQGVWDGGKSKTQEEKENEDHETKTLKTQVIKTEQRQQELEKQLANLHLENSSLKKDMRGA